jgi:hypothetical protein
MKHTSRAIRLGQSDLILLLLRPIEELPREPRKLFRLSGVDVRRNVEVAEPVFEEGGMECG